MPKRIFRFRIKIVSKFIRKILSFERIRSYLIFQIKHNYFHELGHSIQLNSVHRADILEYDAYDPFSEIFIQQEYEDFLPKANIRKLLDIGANFGYFSLWLQSKKPKIQVSSLMIEASPRCRRSLETLVNQKILNGRFKWCQRAIGNPLHETVDFFDRPYMASSIFETSNNEPKTPIKILQIDEISKALPGPYDLIKCDIEGSEWDFIKYYQAIISKSKYLLLEWHSWHSGGGGLSQLLENLCDLGFKNIKSSEPIPAVGREGEVGLILFENTKI